jgi:ATP-binding cassette subfamily B protein/subfamily B ATP-binding cassette protein MsbA
MKNFLRALKSTWPYRRRLVFSIFCALIAAIFWGLTFAAILPALKIIEHKQNLEEWAQSEADAAQKKIAILEKEREGPVKEVEELNARPRSEYRDKRLRDLTRNISKTDVELQSVTWKAYLFQLAAWKAGRFLPSDPFFTLACVLAFVVLTVVLRGIFEFGQDSLVGSVVNLSLFDLRNRLYRNVVHLDVAHFTNEGTNELMSRFTFDMETLGTGTKTLFGKVVSEPLKALVCVLAACWFSWRLTLTFLIMVPIAVFLLNKVGRLMKRATRRLLERMSSIYKILQESFQGIRVVKAFTMEPYERRRFRAATRDYYHKSMWVVNLDALTSPVIEALGMMAIASALLVGAYLVIRGKTHLFDSVRMTEDVMSHETLLQFYAYLVAIADPVRKLSSVYTKIQSGGAAADRIYAFMDRQPRVRNSVNAGRLTPHESTIEFRGVCFSYEPGRPILTNIDLHVRFGETVALVGRNGCGKTTLMGLIPRFYDPDHGSILVDDQDLRQISLRSLRQQIGLVTQDTVLFDDTIYNNITYGNRRVRPEDVEKAAVRAYAHDFIMKLSEGYQTRVGEAGAKLSGGQKQRLALARAILRNPRILLLDEFTSQSDVEGEALIHKALREFMRDRTTFVITHRLNTLELADRIVMVENGRVAAVGAHRDLLQSCPAYQRLHEVHTHRMSA